MESEAVIRCRLDLLIRLIDTTTGLAVSNRGVNCYRSDTKLTPMQKGDGNYIFIGLGREDFLMRIQVDGYDEKELSVSYEDLDKNLPSIDVFLIPSENTPNVLSLTGRMRGLESIEAVQLGNPVCSISEFDPKENRMKLFPPNRQMNMEGGQYGLLHGDRDYERFEVVKQREPAVIYLKNPLQEEFAVSNPIQRLIFGCVDAKGNYTLRIRDTASKAGYLLRFATAERVKYQVIQIVDGVIVEDTKT